MSILEGTEPVAARIAELERYMRRTFERRRRGRPRENTVGVLNAYDDWLLDPATSWRLLAVKHGFRSKHVLECAVLRLDQILEKEGILVPDRAQNIPSHN